MITVYISLVKVNKRSKYNQPASQPARTPFRRVLSSIKRFPKYYISIKLLGGRNGGVASVPALHSSTLPRSRRNTFPASPPSPASPASPPSPASPASPASIPQRIRQGISHTISQGICEGIRQRISRRLSQRIPQRIRQRIPEGISERISDGITQTNRDKPQSALTTRKGLYSVNYIKLLPPRKPSRKPSTKPST